MTFAFEMLTAHPVPGTRRRKGLGYTAQDASGGQSWVTGITISRRVLAFPPRGL